MKRLAAVVLGLAVLAAGCVSENTAEPTSIAATSGSTTTLIAPEEGVTAGKVCSEPGHLGLTADGAPLICSGSAHDGTLLDEPLWRETAAGDVGPILPGSTEAAAAQVVRDLDPTQESAGDEFILVMIDEYAQTARVADETGFPVDEAFVNLVDGFWAANEATHGFDESVISTVAMLEGVVALLDESDEGHAFAAELLRWYREDAVKTYFGLVSEATPEAEARFLSSPFVSPFLASNSDLALDLGYENCGAASQGDPGWWAGDFRDMVEAEPQTDRIDMGLGYLAIAEIALTELCSQYEATWENTKDLLVAEAWYPTRSEFPDADDFGLAGLFR